MSATAVDPTTHINPLDRITSTSTWGELNRGLQHAIERAPTDKLKLELAAFKLDINRELHKKFGAVETK